MRRFSTSWSNTLSKLGFRRTRKRLRKQLYRNRQIELLEDRRLMAVVPVSNLNDVSNGTTDLPPSNESTT